MELHYDSMRKKAQAGWAGAQLDRSESFRCKYVRPLTPWLTAFGESREVPVACAT